MSKKKKYRTELKSEIAKKYESGKAELTELAEEYGIDKGSIQTWRDAYREHGIFGLESKSRKYTAIGTLQWSLKIGDMPLIIKP